MGRSEVCHPTEEVEVTIPECDEGVPAEDDGLAPVGGFGELGEHDPSDTGLKTMDDTDEIEINLSPTVINTPIILCILITRIATGH